MPAPTQNSPQKNSREEVQLGAVVVCGARYNRSMNSNDKTNLKRGTKVLVTNRQGGPADQAVIYKREVIKSYYEGGDDLVYYHLVGWGVIVPAQDIVGTWSA
ncbi:hypothetical protein PBI_COLTRANE_44 [Microbacterium phage Coltrane]|uniref:Uncharacterized protein n=5 Tax=Armstrongvirus armstrong TaxID=2734217 RepID=A0A3G2KDK7_9CAUD|nr:hypothetical protein PBI_BRAHMS_44 [Microbacterium phage Brahms]AYN57021.1 hypothetical protein PBI_BERNSTEIN_44 [Microbacterium phage Bernstein]AYN57380.1 hypothetical protein PBI_COLTRANE_44 [Microbacterium phage Coltrane]AYN58968.1 hypothetical protein PBI_ROLLINS_44 [Microbacterium phage Rollins]